jgi:peptidoglycan/LPS O-acetylase OafA/YrhL
MDHGGEHIAQGRFAHGRIDDIEVLRAIAIAMVLVEHFALVLIPWVKIKGGPIYGHFGFWSGVDLFFVISGFVIGRSLLPSLPPASDRGPFFKTALSFWVRRAWRLAPSAWLWLAIPTAATVVFNRSGAFGLLGPNVRCAISGVLGLANIHFARTFLRPPGGGMMLHYWSLSLEEQFYLVLPFLVFFTRKRLPIALAAIVAAQLFLRRMGPGGNLLLNLVRSDALALGVLLSIWSRTPSYARLEPRMLKAWPARLLLPAVFLLIFAYVSRVTETPPSFLIGAIALMAAVIVWVASYDGDYLLPPGRLKRAACWMGSRSYAMYLIHVPAYLATREIWFRLSPGIVSPGLHHKAILIATALPLTLLLAELNFRFVEDPLRRRGGRIAARMLRREPSALPEAVQHAA